MRELLPVDLTREERSVVLALARLAKRWPKSLGIYSMAGTLCVMREPAARTGAGGLDPDMVLWSTRAISNDGGDW